MDRFHGFGVLSEGKAVRGCLPFQATVTVSLYHEIEILHPPLLSDFSSSPSVLEWDARSYLGSEMYRQWQDSLVDESLQKERREARRERRAKKKDRKLLRLQRKLHQTQADEAASRRSSTTQSVDALETPRRLSSTLSSTSLEDVKAQKLDSAASRPKTAPEPDIASATELPSPVRRGTLFSRLTRPRNASSYGKDLDKATKEKEITHSASVPNLLSPSLIGEKADMFHTIHESEEDAHVQASDDGLFV